MSRRPRAALYVRQSQTIGEGVSASLATQQADLEELAERRGWQVAGVYADRDAPADALDRRIRWLDLLDDAQAGQIDVVAAYDTSRLWRSVELRIATCRELAKAGVERIATMAGDQPTDLQQDPKGNSWPRCWPPRPSSTIGCAR